MGLVAYGSRSSVNDIELIARVVAGDAAAERELYETYVDRIYRLTFRLAGDDELARDFTQATFIRAFEKIGSFRGESSLSTWIHSIGVSVSLNGLRKTKRLRTREAPTDGRGDACSSRARSEGKAGEGDRLAVGQIQDGIRDARRRRLHARGDKRDAQHSCWNVEVPPLSGTKQAARRTGRFCTGVGVMTEDKFEDFLKKAAQSYNEPPARTPREDMWSAIQARRAAGPRVVYGGGSKIRESSGRRFGSKIWLGAAAAAVLFLAIGVGIGRWTASSNTQRSVGTTNSSKTVSNLSSTAEPSTGEVPDGSAGASNRGQGATSGVETSTPSGVARSGGGQGTGLTGGNGTQVAAGEVGGVPQ